MSKLSNTEGSCYSSFFSLIINSKQKLFYLGRTVFQSKSKRCRRFTKSTSQARAQDTMDNNEEKYKSLAHK